MNLKKRIFAIFLVMICLLSAVPINAHHAYFLAVTIDPATFEYIGTVAYEDTGWLQNQTHAEVKLNAVFTMSKGWSDITDDYEDLLESDEDVTEELRKFYIGDDSSVSANTGIAGWDSKKCPGDASMAFTFPSYHPTVWNSLVGASAGTDAGDESRAQRVCDYAIRDLNKCLNWIRSVAYSGRIPDMNAMKLLAAKVSSKALDGRDGSTATLTVNSHTISFSKATETQSPGNGLSLSDYVKVTITKPDGSSSSQEFCCRVPKGYIQVTGDTLYARNKTGAYLNLMKGDREDGADVKWIDWELIVMQGNYNADVSKTTFQNLQDIVNPGVFASWIGGLAKWAITTITGFLQLKPYEDFFLIRNQVATEYTYGLFPSSFLPPALLLYTASLTLAMSLIGFSVLKILWKQQLSTVNVGEKIAMQESLKNLIITLFLFFAFVPIFIFLAGLNALICELFASTVVNSDFTGIITISYVNFGSIIMGIAELILEVYFNFFYVCRGATIVVLFGVSPLAIYTISLGGKISGIFSAYMKELISQIFTQSVHAAMAAFFFNATAYSAMSAFERTVILFSFIPVTKFVKTKIFQLTDGPASQVATTGVKTATGAVSGAAKGISNHDKGGSRAGGGSGGSGGSGGGSGGSILSSALERVSGQQRGQNAASRTLGMRDTPIASGGTAGAGAGGGSSSTEIGRPIPTIGPVGGGADGTMPSQWKPAGIGAMDMEAIGRFGSGMLKASALGAKASLYGGMALGTAMIGEDPSRFTEEAGKSWADSYMTRRDANKEALLYVAADGIRNQEIKKMEEAGLVGRETNGSTWRYTVNPKNANDVHAGVYNDIKKAYESTDGTFTDEQKKAQAFYRDNYGVTGASMQSGENGHLMSIEMDAAKMAAQRINPEDPFLQMKSFNWKPEKETTGNEVSSNNSSGSEPSSEPESPLPPTVGPGFTSHPSPIDATADNPDGTLIGYDINTDLAQARYNPLYEDMRNTFVKADGAEEFTAEQRKGQKFYDEHYGIKHVEFGTDGDPNSMRVIMNKADMEANNVNQEDPFRRMKTYGTRPPVVNPEPDPAEQAEREAARETQRLRAARRGSGILDANVSDTETSYTINPHKANKTVQKLYDELKFGHTLRDGQSEFNKKQQNIQNHYAAFGVKGVSVGGDSTMQIIMDNEIMSQEGYNGDNPFAGLSNEIYDTDYNGKGKKK